MGFTFNLEGIQDTINQLRKLDGEVAEAVNNELAASTEMMAKTAKQLAPVDTGKLRNSISASQVAPLTWELVAQTDYAAYVEFGTGKFVRIPEEAKAFAEEFKGKGKREINRNAQPFFFPAYYAHRKELIENIKAELARLKFR